MQTPEITITLTKDSDDGRECGRCGLSIRPVTVHGCGVQRYHLDGRELCLDCAARTDRTLHDRASAAMLEAWGREKPNNVVPFSRAKRGSGNCTP